MDTTPGGRTRMMIQRSLGVAQCQNMFAPAARV